MQTKECVLKPAGLLLFSRSKPITLPAMAANINLKVLSILVEINTEFILITSVK